MMLTHHWNRNTRKGLRRIGGSSQITTCLKSQFKLGQCLVISLLSHSKFYLPGTVLSTANTAVNELLPPRGFTF